MKTTLLAAMLICATASWPGHADEFFSIGNENPLLRGVYLPRASSARAHDSVSFSADAAISNTLNVESHSHEQLFVDGESTSLRLGLDAALAPDWRYRLSIPLIHDGGGFLDSTIQSWHKFFGLPQGNRPYYPKNQLRYSYLGNGHTELDVAHTGIGDLAAEVGWFAFDADEHTVSMWAGVEAPTGSARELTGDGAWDGAVWLHAAQRYSRWRFGGEAGIVQTFGDEIFGGNAHRASAFARAAATWDATRTVALRLQFDGQSARLRHTDLRFLGPSLSASLGASIRMRRQWRLELGFAEDAAVDTAPDVSFFLGIRRYAAH